MWRVWLELAPWLLLGAAIAGVLHAWLPPGFLRRRLAGRGGVAKAVLLGVPLPLCSCGVIPTGLGLKKQGAGDGATVGFLISTPQTGVDSVLVTAAMLGMPFALLKVVVAAATGLIGGLLADRVARPSLPVIDTPTEEQTHRGSRWRAAAEHGGEVLRSIWRWIVVGVFVSAAIETWLPADGLAALSGYGGLAGMGAALAISLPLYVCATASVPIAASLVEAGLPVGAALVFLMAGPATNVATIGAVYRTLGGRQLAVYLSTIIAGSVAGGMLLGVLIEPAAAASTPHTHPTPWPIAITAGALALVFAGFAAADLRRWLAKDAVGTQRPSPKPKTVVAVDGMTCGGCVAKLERTLTADPRVASANVTLEPGRAEVRGDLDAEAVEVLIRKAGFTPRAGADDGAPV